MATIKLEVVTPTGKVLETQADSVTAPGAAGEFGVLPDHRPGIVMLGGGTLRHETGGREGTPIYIRGGVAEIRPDGVLVLADEATRGDAVDRNRAEAILASAERALDEQEYRDAETQRHLDTDRGYAEAMLKTAGH
jgi:F-type H+-transporting ATPase subunit epsilon